MRANVSKATPGTSQTPDPSTRADARMLRRIGLSILSRHCCHNTASMRRGTACLINLQTVNSGSQLLHHKTRPLLIFQVVCRSSAPRTAINEVHSPCRGCLLDHYSLLAHHRDRRITSLPHPSTEGGEEPSPLRISFRVAAFRTQFNLKAATSVVGRTSEGRRIRHHITHRLNSPYPCYETITTM